MSKTRLKLILSAILLGLSVLFIYLAITGASLIITYFSIGADPSSAFNVIPSAPADLDKRLKWLKDDWTGRPLEAPTRDKIAGAYLRGWAQMNISYAIGEPYGLGSYFSGPALASLTSTITETLGTNVHIEQADVHHSLKLRFYADDGSIIAFTDQEAITVWKLTSESEAAPQVIETRATYDVVMLLDQGNWKIHLWQKQKGVVDPLPPPQRPTTKFMTVNDDSLLWNGKPYRVAGVNYYPRAYSWNDYWPNYSRKQTAIDLTIMRALGLNTVRIFIPFKVFGEDKIEPKYLGYLLDFLNQAEHQGLKVIVTLFDHRTDHRLENWVTDDRHLALLIPYFANHPTILAWDIKNEADGDYALNSPELTQAWLRHIAYEVRKYDRNHLITIGWAVPEAAVDLIDVVDFVSYHYNAPAKDYARRLLALEEVVKDKPILLQELSLPTWNTFWPDGHTETEQLIHYANIMAVERLSRSTGYIVWTLYDYEHVNLEQFPHFWQKGAQANMGVIKLDGKFKPAARLLNPNADLSDIPALPPWSRFTKPFWLMIIGVSLLGTLILWAWLLRHHLRQYCQRLAENQSKLNHFIKWLNVKLRQVSHLYKQTFISRLWLQIIHLITWLAKIISWLKSAIAYYLPWRVLNRWLVKLQLKWHTRSERPRKPTKKSTAQLSQYSASDPISAIDLEQEHSQGTNKYRQLPPSDTTSKRKLARRLRRSRLRGRLRR